MDFYRIMNEGELRAYLEQILLNLEAQIMVDEMKKELEKLLVVFEEKGIDPEDNSLQSKLKTLRFYVGELARIR